METKHQRRLFIQGSILFAALIIQYALGMAANLFLEFPQNATIGQLWGFAWSQTLIAAHITLGILIGIGALVLFIRALVYKSGLWTMFSGVALLAIFVAAGSGSFFISSQNNVYSYSMSLAFIVALISYGWGLYAQRKYSQSETSALST